MDRMAGHGLRRFAVGVGCFGLLAATVFLTGCATPAVTTERMERRVRGQNPDGAAATALPPLPDPAAPAGEEEVYPFDPMRGAAVSTEPPADRGVYLRERLGLGRSDLADEPDDAFEPIFPRLHDDPLARSDVAPERRDRLMAPWLSNLVTEHVYDLADDPAEERRQRLRRRSRYDVTDSGPDTANFPNSAFTLPKGRVYIETSPGSFYGKSTLSPAQYNAEFLFRYGVTDDLEFRLFSNGYTATRGPLGTTGFSPLVFDLKLHLWDENPDTLLPAAGLETYIQTPFGSTAFAGGTQPSIALNLDHTLPFKILLEHNFGITGLQDTFGTNVYVFSYQWSLQREIFKDVAVFTHGFYNASALPRLPIFQSEIRNFDTPAVVVGGGLLWNLSRRLAVFGSYNAGVTRTAPSTVAQLGLAVAL